MNWFITALKKYADFSGRAQRSEYWYFILFYFLIYLGLFVISAVGGRVIGSAVGVLLILFSLAMLIPSLSVCARRLHDTDRTGWWMLISLVPLLGGIILLIFLVQDSQPGENRFGLNPKEAS